MSWRLLGVLGGMGMQATEYFCRLVTDMQSVQAEQEYLDMLVYCKPSIPDRSAYILGTPNAQSPIDALRQAAQTLEKAGATCIAMPCVTAHYFHKELAESVDIPLLNALDETAGYAASKGYRKIGLLATTGTIAAGLFDKVLTDIGISVVKPTSDEQASLMDLIYEVKQGRDVNDALLDNFSVSLHKKGAEAIVLGCSELSLLSDENSDYIDAMRILAKATLEG